MYIGDSTYEHKHGGLTKYKGNLLTVGGYKNNQRTEIMKKEENDILKWSAVESDFNFTRGEWICDHSLVTVESSDINEEYILLIGEYNDQWRISKNVFKSTGSWFRFRKLNKRRYYHNSINLNGAVYVIG